MFPTLFTFTLCNGFLFWASCQKSCCLFLKRLQRLTGAFIICMYALLLLLMYCTCRTFWSRIWGFSLALHTYWYTQLNESLKYLVVKSFSFCCMDKRKGNLPSQVFLFEIRTAKLRLVFWDWFWFFSYEIILSKALRLSF